MNSLHRNVLLFGDVTDPWVDGIDYVFRQAAAMPWLRSFLGQLFSAFRAETKHMDRTMQDSLGTCSSFQEMAQRYRHTADDFGMGNAMLLFALRASILLETALKEPSILNPTSTDSEVSLVGISGGLFSAAAVPVATNLETLQQACLEAAKVFCRVCNLSLEQSRAMEDQSGAWGWAVLGLSPEELAKALEKFQDSIGVPAAKRARIGIIGDRWSTVIGPPSILTLIMSRCAALKDCPKNQLDIRAMQHTLDITDDDVAYVVGSSPFLDTPLCPGYKIWGFDDPNATYSTWGDLLRAAVRQVLSRPLDILQVLGDLKKHLGDSPQVDLKIMGPSSHTTYLVKTLQIPGRNISISNHLEGQETIADADTGGRIAIVGMGGKGPGSDDLEEFWNVILAGQDLHEEIPPDRFDLDEYYCPKHGTGGPGKCTMTCRHGCFIKKPGSFDSKFFHISPREAMLMDPAHRLFLMNAYEALEMAGYSSGLTKTTDPNKVAVFFGQCTDDWHTVGHQMLGCDAYTLQSVQRAFGPGRLAFQMNWEGPTYALDSACASATSCIHLACMGLLTGDIDMAVAGATNVLSDPHSFASLSMSGVLSDTGNCKTYRDDADGYCRADFSGAVVLKRLEDAVAHNDNILAVVASSARNHSGNSPSITTSDAAAQERLFRKVLRNARVTPQDISYIEMHGTGTQVGDKAEMGAVSNVFSQDRRKEPLPVGAIKANMGHSEAAAGMSSLLKSILMFQKDTIPPQAGIPHSLNPKLPRLEDIGVTIPSKPIKFPSTPGKPRRILLNNFDASGGNACMVLEEYLPQARKSEIDPRSAHTIVTSARTPASHLNNKRRLLEWLRATPNVRIEDLAYTTTARRMHHPIRSALVATTTQEAISKLEAEMEHENGTSEVSSSRTRVGSAGVVFVFSGQGSQYPGMGAELYRTSPVFREKVDRCVAISKRHHFPPFLDIIADGTTDLSTKDAAQVQLATLTLEIALGAVWHAAGIEPAAVMGHSLGEYAALHVAGVLSLADTLYLVGRRAGLLMERCEADSCSMLSLSAPASVVREQLDRHRAPLCDIACVNGPRATVVSGTAEDLRVLQEDMTMTAREQEDGKKIRATHLPVPFAFHSFQMDPILSDYRALASGVTYWPPRVPVASCLLGSLVDGPDVFDQDYLAQQTRQKVDFVGALRAVQSKLHDPVWLEIGPSAVCTSFVRATLSPDPAKVMHTIDANTTNWTSISKCLSSAYLHGVDIDWRGLHSPYESNLQLLSLPTYAWDVKNFWITHTDRKSVAASGQLPQAPAPAPKPFMGTCAQYIVSAETSSSGRVSATFRASISDPGFLGLIEGHKMQQIGLASGSVFCDAAATAAKYALEYSGRKDVSAQSLTLHDPELLAPLTTSLVGADGELLTTASLESKSADTVTVSFKATSSRASHDLGTMRVEVVRDPTKTQMEWDRLSFFIKARMDERIARSKDGSGHRMHPDVVYALFANAVEFSAPFRGIQEAYVAGDFQEAAALALMHLAGFLVNGNPNKSPQTTFIVMGFGSTQSTAALQPGRHYWTYVRVARWDGDTAYCDAFVFDAETSRLVTQCRDLRYQELPRATWRHILEGPHHTKTQTKPHQKVSVSVSPQRVQTSAPVVVKEANENSPTIADKTPLVQQESAKEEEEERDGPATSGLFDAILHSISAATGSDPSEFTDDAMLANLGVDSIMAIEIISAVKAESGLDLPAAFVFEYPTIGDLRREFGGQPNVEETQGNKDLPLSEAGDSTPPVLVSAPASTPSSSSLGWEEEEIQTIESSSPAPTVKITLLQGRPGPGRTPLYMMADGTGTVATYIHLPSFRSRVPVYGIDSPFLHCPERMINGRVGMEGVAKLIVDALTKAQPTGPMWIGGFSAGSLVGYEVARQLAAAGRRVQGLLLIDMCSPRAPQAPQGQDCGGGSSLSAEGDFSFGVFEAAIARDGHWGTTATTRQHFRAYHVAMHQYHPPPAPVLRATGGWPAQKTAIIWAEKGLVHRVADDAGVMRMLRDQGIATTAYPGYMQDPALGTFATLVPDKTAADLGPNGWDRYVGPAPLVMSVPGDHLDLPMPGHVHLLQRQMEKALAYFGSDS
ncbi:hypothetical protein PG984_006358 [Apiospora sp. TS-2023a]